MGVRMSEGSKVKCNFSNMLLSVKNITKCNQINCIAFIYKVPRIDCEAEDILQKRVTLVTLLNSSVFPSEIQYSTFL